MIDFTIPEILTGLDMSDDTEVTESMVDRVARAIQASVYPNDPFDDLIEEGREVHRATARAAIAAMRDPTQEMLDAGGWAVAQRNGDMTPEAEALAQFAWPAMVDEALK